MNRRGVYTSDTHQVKQHIVESQKPGKIKIDHFLINCSRLDSRLYAKVPKSKYSQCLKQFGFKIVWISDAV